MDAITAKDYISSGQFVPVLQLDQLVQQRRLGKVLFGFQEAEIKFKPTYKYDPGTDNWDSRQVTFFCRVFKNLSWKYEIIFKIYTLKQ